jgi:hypothetical protein
MQSSAWSRVLTLLAPLKLHTRRFDRNIIYPVAPTNRCLCRQGDSLAARFARGFGCVQRSANLNILGDLTNASSPSVERVVRRGQKAELDSEDTALIEDMILT